MAERTSRARGQRALALTESEGSARRPGRRSSSDQGHLRPEDGANERARAASAIPGACETGDGFSPWRPTSGRLRRRPAGSGARRAPRTRRRGAGRRRGTRRRRVARRSGRSVRASARGRAPGREEERCEQRSRDADHGSKPDEPEIRRAAGSVALRPRRGESTALATRRATAPGDRACQCPTRSCRLRGSPRARPRAALRCPSAGRGAGRRDPGPNRP